MPRILKQTNRRESPGWEAQRLSVASFIPSAPRGRVSLTEIEPIRLPWTVQGGIAVHCGRRPGIEESLPDLGTWTHSLHYVFDLSLLGLGLLTNTDRKKLESYTFRQKTSP